MATKRWILGNMPSIDSMLGVSSKQITSDTWVFWIMTMLVVVPVNIIGTNSVYGASANLGTTGSNNSMGEPQNLVPILSSVERSSDNVKILLHDTALVEVLCRADEMVTGGGYHSDSNLPHFFIYLSHPFYSSSNNGSKSRSGWEIGVQNEGGGGDADFSGYIKAVAVCSKIKFIPK
jgi:hypothetical protein